MSEVWWRRPGSNRSPRANYLWPLHA